MGLNFLLQYLSLFWEGSDFLAAVGRSSLLRLRPGDPWGSFLAAELEIELKRSRAFIIVGPSRKAILMICFRRKRHIGKAE